MIKTKGRIENELQEKIVMIHQNQSVSMENERKRKNAENLINEWQMKSQEAEKSAAESKSALTKVSRSSTNSNLPILCYGLSDKGTIICLIQLCMHFLLR